MSLEDNRKKFALIWMGITLFLIYRFLESSWSQSSTEISYFAERMAVVTNIIVISGVSFGMAFLALNGLAGGLFPKKRRR